jgi:hypothetical protein
VTPFSGRNNKQSKKAVGSETSGPLLTKQHLSHPKRAYSTVTAVRTLNVKIFNLFHLLTRDSVKTVYFPQKLGRLDEVTRHISVQCGEPESVAIVAIGRGATQRKLRLVVYLVTSERMVR